MINIKGATVWKHFSALEVLWNAEMNFLSKILV